MAGYAEIRDFDIEDFSQSFSEAAHQLTHILGFSETSFDLFQKPNNAGTYSVDDLIVKKDGRNLFRGPTVVEKARKYFECVTAEGMPLARQDSNHWDSLILPNEYMNQTPDADSVYTFFTFALLQDSGWYSINWEKVDTPTYGAGLGCGPLEADCMVDGLCGECDLNNKMECTRCVEHSERTESGCKCSAGFHEEDMKCVANAVCHKLCDGCDEKDGRMCDKCVSGAVRVNGDSGPCRLNVKRERVRALLADDPLCDTFSATDAATCATCV